MHIKIFGKEAFRINYALIDHDVKDFSCCICKKITSRKYKIITLKYHIH